MLSLRYFTTFSPYNFVEQIVENTNLYSVRCHQKGVDTDVNGVETFIRINTYIGVINCHMILTIAATNSAIQPLQMQCHGIDFSSLGATYIFW